jgi:hypothetical protein
VSGGGADLGWVVLAALGCVLAGVGAGGLSGCLRHLADDAEPKDRKSGWCVCCSHFKPTARRASLRLSLRTKQPLRFCASNRAEK